MAPFHPGRLPAVTEELLRALPKTDLHCHLDGSLRLATILDLAEKQKVRLPADTPEGLAKAIHMGETCESLEDYLVAFDVTLAVLQTEEALYRAAYELATDCAAENVRYLEVRYSPVLHTRQGLKPTTIVDAVLDGLRHAKRESGIKSNVIICGIRHMDPQTSVRLAELAVAYKGKGVVGFDLAGAEEGHPARQHHEAIQLILDNNVNVTIHAGEAYGPDSIAQAVHKCGAHRIGHGVRLRENGDLLNYVNDHRIPLEMCPSSNVQTGSVAGFASHPLKFYFDFGLRVTRQHRQPAHHRHDRHEGARPRPPRDGLHARGPLHGARAGLQERVPAVPREAGPAPGGERRDRGGARAASPRPERRGRGPGR